MGSWWLGRGKRYTCLPSIHGKVVEACETASGVLCLVLAFSIQETHWYGGAEFRGGPPKCLKTWSTRCISGWESWVRHPMEKRRQRRDLTAVHSCLMECTMTGQEATNTSDFIYIYIFFSHGDGQTLQCVLRRAINSPPLKVFKTELH